MPSWNKKGRLNLFYLLGIYKIKSGSHINYESAVLLKNHFVLSIMILFTLILESDICECTFTFSHELGVL